MLRLCSSYHAHLTQYDPSRAVIRTLFVLADHLQAVIQCLAQEDALRQELYKSFVKRQGEQPKTETDQNTTAE